MVGPAVLAVLSLTVYPAAYAVWLSSTDANLLRFAAAESVGPGNYAKAFADEIFLGSLGRTLRYVVAVAGTQMLLALPVALFLNTAFFGRGLVRSTILIPWVVPGAVVAIIWRFLVHPNLGVVNDVLLRLGLISEYLVWIADPVRSFVIIVVATLWTGFPFFTIMLLASLQAIPGDLYEVSRVDGAGAWQRFRYVTLPLLWPSMLLLLLLRTIGLAHGVDLIFLLTGGGPGYDNYTVAVYSFILAWNQFEIGYASALAVMLSLVLLTVSAVYVWLIERSRAWM
jgi:multiple sugar transport system permease protein